MSATTKVTAPARFPAGTTPEGDGVVVGRGAVRVDAYIDFQCPFCRQFEERSGRLLDRLIAGDAITLVTHPMDFLDALSTNHYSSRAASASGCAADGGRFREYAKILFANQPPEGSPGLTDDELAELAHAVGLGGDVDECIASHVYIPWTQYVTARAAARGVSGTPSVLVAGVPVPANPAIIGAAVADLAP